MRKRVCRLFTDVPVGCVLKVLAIDIGSTRLKAALLDADSQVISSLSSISQPSPLAGSNIRADHVLHATGLAASLACDGTRPDVIALTAATRTSVFTAPDSQALGEVIKWDDSRGVDYTAALQQAYDAPNDLGLGAFHPLARALDVRDHDPTRYQQTRWLLELKDWINLRLTGQACTDNTSWRRVQSAQRSMVQVLHTLGLKPDLLAPPIKAATTLGVLQNHINGWPDWQGLPVVACGFDAWCASYGMGCVRAGAAYNVSGTTDVFGSFSADHVDIAGVSCLPWGSGLNHIGGPSSTGLATLAWFGNKYLNSLTITLNRLM